MSNDRVIAPTNLERFQFDVLHQRIVDEQNLFWQRFSAFSALTAGLFVLATSNAVENKALVPHVGLVLALAWTHVQFMSWHHVNRDKDKFFEMCDKWHLRPVQSYRFLSSKYWPSSTTITAIVPLVALTAWGVLLYPYWF